MWSSWGLTKKLVPFYGPIYGGGRNNLLRLEYAWECCWYSLPKVMKLELKRNSKNVSEYFNAGVTSELVSRQPLQEEVWSSRLVMMSDSPKGSEWVDTFFIYLIFWNIYFLMSMRIVSNVIVINWLIIFLFFYFYIFNWINSGDCYTT